MSNLIISPGKDENKTYSKPPPSSLLAKKGSKHIPNILMQWALAVKPFDSRRKSRIQGVKKVQKKLRFAVKIVGEGKKYIDTLW